MGENPIAKRAQDSGPNFQFKSGKPASWWLEGARRTGDAKLIKAWEDAVNSDWDALHYDPTFVPRDFRK